MHPMKPICYCGHSKDSHKHGECEGCANDGEDGYCRRYETAGYEDQFGTFHELFREPSVTS